MKLHVGCGKRFIPGFTHIDLDDFPHIDHRHDIKTFPFLKDSTAELLYSCHAFEYFDRVEAMTVLKEWKRVLKPGGVIRLAVPDFEALGKVYQQTGELDRIVGPLFGRIEIKTPQGSSCFYHKTTYDFKALRSVLEAAGFRDVRRWDWRETEHTKVDDFSQAYFPHMDKEKGLLISLNVEATKAE
ncbi:MAG: methyltransferase domain-containing protein [Pseudobdellovibrionaceae bacterium]